MPHSRPLTLLPEEGHLQLLLVVFLHDESHVIKVCALILPRVQLDDFLVIWMRVRLWKGFLDDLAKINDDALQVCLVQHVICALYAIICVPCVLIYVIYALIFVIICAQA
jgi:hypothetical protein